MKREAQKVRITLKAIEGLTYTCSNQKLLSDLNQSLDHALLEFRNKLPCEQGLVIRPLMAKKKKRSENSLKVQKVSSLPLHKKRGRTSQDSKYRNRVGRRADKLRKVRNCVFKGENSIKSCVCVFLCVCRQPRNYFCLLSRRSDCFFPRKIMIHLSLRKSLICMLYSGTSI